MISLSNLIKSFSYKTLADKVHIEVLDIAAPQLKSKSRNTAEASDENPSSQADREAAEIREQLLRDAEEMAERRIREAQEQANAMLEKARLEIETWWEEQRARDEQVVSEAKQTGFDEGYADGTISGEQAAREQYAARLEEAQSILQTAHEQKQAMINEAEPFILELSCDIARKIIDKQLTINPEWVSDMIKKILARRVDQRAITLCVAPKHYDYILDAKEDLRQVIDPQAELLIVPDNSVKDDGCIVRTDFGSLDARIDTQLSEIRTALLQIAYADAETDGV